MFTLRYLWSGVLVLGVILTLAQGTVPARADGMDKSEAPAAQGSDARQFLEELRRGGALKFYEDTEDVLRAGKFERAYIRYIFLRAHLRGLDAGLTPMVEQRLHFLKEQMHLGEGVHYAARDTMPMRKKAAKPACPPPEPKEVKKPAPDSEEKSPEIVIPPAPPEEKPAPPKEEAKPPGEEAPKPAPAPSAWEKIKRRLKFW